MSVSRRGAVITINSDTGDRRYVDGPNNVNDFIWRINQ